MQFNRKLAKKTEELNPLLAIDIGTEYVKSVVYLIEDREVHVIGYNRTKQSETAMQGAYIVNLLEVIDSVDRSVGQSISMAENNTKKKVNVPQEVIMGIAGELVQGVTILVNVEREDPEKIIERNELMKVLENVRTNSFESSKTDIAEEIGINPELLEEIDTEINSVYIDGVRVNNPLKFKGKAITYRVFSTFSPKLHVDSIRQVAKELNLTPKIIVEPYALSLALKNIRDSKSSAIFVDLGGGTTDVALVINGDIEGTKMFAVGGRVFTKRLEKDLALSYEEAEKLKIDYSDDKLPEHKKNEVKKAVSKDINLWLSGVQLALESFEDVTEFPSEVYLCGGGALLPDIQEGLISYPWQKYLKFNKFPKFNFFFPNEVRQVVDKTREATLPIDVTPLALARMSLDEED